MCNLLALRGLLPGVHLPRVSFLLAANGGATGQQATFAVLLAGKCNSKSAAALPVLPCWACTPSSRFVTCSTLRSPADGSRGQPVSDLVKGKDMEWRSTELALGKLPKYYMELSKVRLTSLVVITAMAGYAMAPGAFSAVTLGLVTSGTLLTSSAANATNQWLEMPYDSQMARTAVRPLVRGQVSPLHAMTFAGVCATAGVGLLYLAHPLAAALGTTNLLLYTAVYTPMKRLSIANTWVGAVVGGIPPLIGWAAAAGTLGPGAWLLAALLFAWQFPHFNALSWNLRKDYARAGYRIMAVTHPELTRRVALRYSLALAALPLVTSACDVTSWMYAIDSLPVNAYLVYLSWRFYRDSDSNTARRLTRFSYLQLTAAIILMLLAKKHYSAETEEPQSNKRAPPHRLRDFCIGEPLINAGWDLGRIVAVAERNSADSASHEANSNREVVQEKVEESVAAAVEVSAKS